MSQDLFRWTAAALAEKIRSRAVSSREVTRLLLERIEAVDPAIRSYLCVEGDLALKRAEEIDRALAAGEDPGPLAGVPIAIKDNICIDGMETTCASKILAGFVPPYDATVIARLKSAGAVLIGKTNMDEFAMGSSTENSAFHPTYNPWDFGRIPGGSSGGSAAAVAADLCFAALGSDTGGSIRQPASLCGVVGLKPTYGRVSRFGLVAFASSLDQIGPLTKDVSDSALLLSVIGGHDPYDSTSADLPLSALFPLRPDIGGLRVGVPREFFLTEGIDPEVRAAVEGAVRTLEGLGAKTVEISLPHSEYAIATYYILATAEASSNLARYDGVRYGFRAKTESGELIEMYSATRSGGFGPEVKRRIMLGTYALSAGYYEAYYGKAQRVRTLIKKDFDDAFRLVDLIAGPTSPTPAFRLGEKSDPLEMYLSDVFTISVNLAGIPAISIPCGFSGSGGKTELPIGLQLMGRPFEEQTLLRAAFAFEQATEYHKKKSKAAA